MQVRCTPSVGFGLLGVFRHARGLRVEERALEEALTDLTTVYLGFGLLTTNGSNGYRATPVDDGPFIGTRWSHRAGGYLGPQALS